MSYDTRTFQPKDPRDFHLDALIKRVEVLDAEKAELTAERDMLAKALEIALVDQERLSAMFSHSNHQEAEDNCDKRIRHTKEVLSKTQKQAPTAQEVREGLA